MMSNLEAFAHGWQGVMFIVGLIGNMIMFTGLLGDFSQDDGQIPQDASWFDKIPLQNQFIVVGASIWLLSYVAGACLDTVK